MAQDEKINIGESCPAYFPSSKCQFGPFQHLPAFVYSPVQSNGCFGLEIILVMRAEDQLLGTFLPYQKSQIVHLLLLSKQDFKSKFCT